MNQKGPTSYRPLVIPAKRSSALSRYPGASQDPYCSRWDPYQSGTLAKTTGPSASLDRGSRLSAGKARRRGPALRGPLRGSRGWPSVRIEPVPVVEAQGRVLVFLLQKAIAGNEDVDL